MRQTPTNFRTWFESLIHQLLKKELDALEKELAWEQVMMMDDPKKFEYTNTPLDPKHAILKMKHLFDTLQREVTGELFMSGEDFYISPLSFDMMQFLSIEPDPKRTLEEVTQVKRDAYLLSPSPRRIVAFDLETDGVDIQNCNILQFAFIYLTWDDVYKIATPTRLSAYTKPYAGWEVCPSAQKINGIGQHTIDQAYPLSKYAPDILKMIEGSILIGYNIHKFDIPILARHLRNLGYGGLPHHMSIDLYQVALKPKLKLSSALKRYDVEVNHHLHDANIDATSCLSLLSRMIQLGDTTLKPHTTDKGGEGTKWILNNQQSWTLYPTPSDTRPDNKRRRIDSYFQKS